MRAGESGRRERTRQERESRGWGVGGACTSKERWKQSPKAPVVSTSDCDFPLPGQDWGCFWFSGSGGIEHTAESSQSAPGLRGARLGEERREGWPAGGSGIAKCVSDLGPSLFHKHLALRKLPAALRGL